MADTAGITPSGKPGGKTDSTPGGRAGGRIAESPTSGPRPDACLGCLAGFQGGLRVPEQGGT